MGHEDIRRAGFEPASPVPQTGAPTHRATRLLSVPPRIRTETVQFLKLTPPANWARGTNYEPVFGERNGANASAMYRSSSSRNGPIRYSCEQALLPGVAGRCQCRMILVKGAPVIVVGSSSTFICTTYGEGRTRTSDVCRIRVPDLQSGAVATVPPRPASKRDHDPFACWMFRRATE